jgi:hypothetical protein
MALLAFLFLALISVKTRVEPAYCDTSDGAVIAKFVDAAEKGTASQEVLPLRGQ